MKKMSLRATTAILTLFAMAAATTACTKSQTNIAAAGANSTTPQAPTVVQVETKDIADADAATQRMAKLKASRLSRTATTASGAQLSTSVTIPTTTTSPVISSKVTFAKSQILNRIFLYGTDLQYSSIGEQYGMLLQSMSVGHVTARFQILGDRLQLLAEEKYRFESNINIPLRLLHEWPIVSQTASDLTVEITTASPTLATVLAPNTQVRSSWVRSVEFVPQGNYLLIESSIETADGQVAEFMESVFPRETLVNAATKPYYADASLETYGDRFGYLANGIWADLPGGRAQTKVAQRFAMPESGKTIDWYVTPNIPPEFMDAVRDGVEGWNRYSQKMWGRDFIAFKGILPPGVKIGDPRYNVINWDSVLDASAAYESQASDPETGIQSHSLIYLPYAWVNIGLQFWKRGELTQDRTATLKASLDKAEFLGKKVSVRCFNEGSLGAITPQLKADPDTFSKALLRGTLFHEVGHALGLAHNFKGSLEWDPDVPGSLFSTSIMDYNHYDLEEAAFDAPKGGKGPMLEYDRQILSVLYHDGKDIVANNRVLPHCDDEVADSKQGGVDPLCIRYDSGKDPSVILERTLALIQDPNASLGKTKSLAHAVPETIAALGNASDVTTDAELMAQMDAFRSQLSGLVQYYVSSGAQGLNYMMTANLRGLAVFSGQDLPADASGFRQRVAGVMDQVMNFDNFSAGTYSAFNATGVQAGAWVQQTPWYATASPERRQQITMQLTDLPGQVLGIVEKLVLPNVRIRQIQNLARSTTAPFFFDQTVDYEGRALDWLDKVLMGRLLSIRRYLVNERMAAAQTLATFAQIPRAATIKAQALSKVEAEIQSASSPAEREGLRALEALLQ